MKTLIVTRRSNRYLYDKMLRSLTIDGDRQPIVGFNKASGARDYLFHCFRSHCDEYDLIINIDEDCLVIDNDALKDLITYFMDCKYDFCGMPDGGRCIHRCHNPLVMNPFFNLFSKNFAETMVMNQREARDQLMPFSDRKSFNSPSIYPGMSVKYDNFEPYYGIFITGHMLGMFPMYLDSREWVDNISTILRNQNHQEFLAHSWFAREYDRPDSIHKVRIDAFHKEFERN